MSGCLHVIEVLDMKHPKMISLREGPGMEELALSSAVIQESLPLVGEIYDLSRLLWCCLHCLRSPLAV